MNGSLHNTAAPRRTARDAAPPESPDRLIDLFRTLADPIRLRILKLLESGAAQNGAAQALAGGLSVGELGEILKLPQSTVSRHLKTLTDAGLIEPRREGTSTFYRLPTGTPSDEVGTALAQLRQITRAALDADPTARNDTHRLAAVLRKRETPKANAGEAFFGKHAPQWDQLRAQWFGDTFHLEGLLALLNPTWTVADIGTGTGAMLPLIAPHVKQVIGIDPSAPMLKAARTRLKNLHMDNIDIRQGTAEALPLEDHTADVALLALVLAYTVSPEAVLHEAHRILKPGGTLLILDLQPHAVELFREKLNHHHMGFSQEQLTQWLHEAGFQNTRWHPLTPRQSRAKDAEGANTPVPDLFALRAEAA